MKTLTDNQLNAVAKYLGDISRVVVASAVVNFFIPTVDSAVSLPTFIIGSIFAVAFFVGSVILTK